MVLVALGAALPPMEAAVAILLMFWLEVLEPLEEIESFVACRSTGCVPSAVGGCVAGRYALEASLSAWTMSRSTTSHIVVSRTTRGS